MAKEVEKKPRRKFVRRDNGELHDTRGLARILNESPHAIRDWRHKGIIPFLRLGHRTIRYRLPAVLAALEKFTIKTK